MKNIKHESKNLLICFQSNLPKQKKKTEYKQTHKFRNEINVQSSIRPI